jgi:hypothetical protein
MPWYGVAIIVYCILFASNSASGTMLDFVSNETIDRQFGSAMKLKR